MNNEENADYVEALKQSFHTTFQDGRLYVGIDDVDTYLNVVSAHIVSHAQTEGMCVHAYDMASWIMEQMFNVTDTLIALNAASMVPDNIDGLDTDD